MLNVITLEEALALIRREFVPGAAPERVPLGRALGRTLAEDVLAQEYVPDFDRSTVDGYALRARDTFGCPVAFYTGTYCEKENYAEMVALLHEIEAKWNIGVIDMFNDEAMTAVFGTEQYDVYMFDQVHPYKVGYVEWWTPVIDAYLRDYMAGVEK